jgi:hypothetical protein
MLRFGSIHVIIFLFYIHNFFFLSEVDLALLSLSDHSIITYGKFGLWGSLLGKEHKVTICPKDFMKTDIGMEVHKAKLPNWIFP